MQGLLLLENRLQEDSCEDRICSFISEYVDGRNRDVAGNCDEDQYSPLVYYVMPRYGPNLQDILLSRDNQLSSASIYTLGL